MPKQPLLLRFGGVLITPKELEAADIIVTTSNSRVSAAIRVGTSSAISHALLYAGSGRVVEAIARGVVERSLTISLATARLAVVYRYHGLDKSLANTIIAFAHSKVGSGYDLGGAIHAGESHYVGGVLADTVPGMILLASTHEHSDRFFCSELVLASYEAAGISLSSYRPSTASPARIVQASASGNLEYIGHLLREI